MNRNDLITLCEKLLASIDLLRRSQEKAGERVNGDPKNLSNCCSATLSFLLIDGIGVSLKPTNRAMCLAYILENELSFKKIAPNEELLPGDIGVVDYMKDALIQATDWEEGNEDSDAFDPPDLLEKDEYEFTGAGYREDDPENRKWHHIYLVVKSSTNGDPPTIADNQSRTLHQRAVFGSGKSPTKYFLRCPD